MMIEMAGARPMHTAPKTGEDIEILFLHPLNAFQQPDREEEFAAWCRGYWTDFNGGGWVWHGLCGTAVAWRPFR